jgi:hypothetical protein
MNPYLKKYQNGGEGDPEDPIKNILNYGFTLPKNEPMPGLGSQPYQQTPTYAYNWSNPKASTPTAVHIPSGTYNTPQQIEKKKKTEERKESFWNTVGSVDKAIGQYLIQPAAELFNTPFALFAEGANAIQGKEYDFGKALPNPTRMAFNAEGMTDMVPQQQFLSDYLGVDRKENPYLALGLDIFTPGPAMVTKPLQALTGIGKASTGAIKYASKMNALDRAIDSPIAFAKKDLNPFYVNEVNPNVGLNFADQSIDASKVLQQAEQNVLNAARQPQVAASTTQAVAKEYTPWTQQEMPGLHIKSTMTGSPFEKQLSKTGELSVSNIQAHINRADVSQQDKFTLQKVLNEKFAGKQKVDYNEFRKAVQEEAVELRRVPVEEYQHKLWGVKEIGYPGLKQSTYETSIKTIEDDAIYYNKIRNLDLKNLKRHTFYEAGSDVGKKKVEFPGRFRPVENIPEDKVENYLASLKKEADEFFENTYPKKSEYEEALKKIPKVQIMTFENAEKFGTGNAKHFNKSTLGHTRTMVDPDQPGIWHTLEQQSDFWQDVKRIIPSESQQRNWNVKSIMKQQAIQEDMDLLEYMKKNKKTKAGDSVDDWQINQFEEGLLKRQEEFNLQKGDFANPQQKEFLGNAHQERLLQENVKLAAENGMNKVRYPTAETAVKIQKYQKVRSTDAIKQANKELEFVENPEAFKAKYGEAEYTMELKANRTLEKYNENPEKFINKRKATLDKHYKALSSSGMDDYSRFSDEHETVLRKYKDNQKMIEKTLGVKVSTVTDAKGNTWYEFDIPDAYKQGKAEIKAFNIGGVIGTGAAGAAGTSLLNQQVPQNRYGGQNPYVMPKYNNGGPIDPVDPEEENKMMQRQINSILSGKPMNTGITMTKLNPDEEYTYQQWAKGLTPNLQGSMDDKNYDMRGAWQVGEQPELFYYDNNEFTSAHPIDVKQQGSIYEPHLFSRNPFTGKSLKGPNHPSFMHALEGDIKAGGKVKMDLKTGDMYTYEKGGNTGYSTVEIERSERVYTPDGKLIMETPADAPTHEDGGVKVTLPAGSLVFPKKYYKALDAASGLPAFKKIADTMLNNAEKAYLSGEPYSSGGKRNKERTYNA